VGEVANGQTGDDLFGNVLQNTVGVDEIDRIGLQLAGAAVGRGIILDSGLAHQLFQQAKLAMLKIDLLALAHHPALQQIHLQIAHLQLCRLDIERRTAAKRILPRRPILGSRM